MNPQTMTRSAVDLYLRAVLAPAKGVARFTRFGKDQTSPLEVAVGRVDAALREAAGRVLSDDELLADAVRRRAAADNRSLAVDLHEEAEQRRAQATEQRREREAQAEKVRAQAEERAEKEKAKAEKDAEQRRRAVREQARSRKQATRKTAARKKESISKAERAARLTELEDKEQALDATEKALSEQERAARLKKAAEATKAAR